MNDKKILLVEDNPDDVVLTLRAFKKSNLSNEIVVVTDGAMALDYLICSGEYAGRNIEDSPSVVLLDLNLPKISGLDVLQRIRNDPRISKIPVVILTTSREEFDIASSYDLGANSFICKPVDFEHFVEAVRNLGLYWLLLNEPPPQVIKPPPAPMGEQ